MVSQEQKNQANGCKVVRQGLPETFKPYGSETFAAKAAPTGQTRSPDTTSIVNRP